MEVNISNLIQTGGIIFAVGFITGLLIKQFIKLALAILGVYTISLLWLQQKGVITINEGKFYEMITNTATEVVGVSEKIVALLPTGGAFAAGFLLALAKT